jgi:DNA polymerase-1
MSRDPVVVDFETKGIEARPKYPPEPVGVAILVPGKKPQYLAWGHPTENNSTKEKARAVLKDLWSGDRSLLFHNGQFDLDVAETHLGLKLPCWDHYHDTLFQLFLHDPHAKSLSLKPAAEKLLGMKPEERDAVEDWLVEHKVVRKGTKGWGAHIADAPGGLAGTYAIGDVVRTLALHKHLHPKLDEEERRAYDRERQLLPILLRNSREGIRLDYARLNADIKEYEAAREKVAQWLRRRLKAKDLNLDSDRDLAEALESSGVVTDFVLTATGQKSVAKANLTVDRFNDPKVASALGYYGRLGTCLSTFLHPWAEMAAANGGVINTSWNQVRQSHGYENSGTRTGRLSCSPNFQNIPKDWYDKGDGYAHPKHCGVPELPSVRRYILPDKGCEFAHRDYNQQELRILAHFEDDVLGRAYNENPRLDMHTFVQSAIKEVSGLEFERRAVKILNFGMVYGMGLGRLAEAIKSDVETARRLKMAQRTAIPGLATLEKDVKKLGREGAFVRTWGGRRYFCEPPAQINGRMQTFEYKLLNYLIQGSAADCTKQALINYETIRKDGRFMVTVHDECNIAVPKKALKEELRLLKVAMESVEFGVPMLSDAKAGPNWGELKKVEE